MNLLFSKVIHSSIAITIKATALTLATLAIYIQDLIALANEALRSELMSYILAVPFIFTYFLYRKRRMLKSTISFEFPHRKPARTREIIAALVCVTAFLLYWHGSYTFHPLEYHTISLPIFIVGLTLLIFGEQTLRVLTFPIAFLLFLIPPPLEVTNAIGTTLSIAASEASFYFLKALGLSVNLVNEYGTPAMVLHRSEGLSLTFVVDIACAGIYSLIGFAIFAVFLSYITRGPAWRRGAVFFAGLPLMYALNIARIIIAVLIGNSHGTVAATQAFHLLGGWVLISLGTMILLTISLKVFKVQLLAKNPQKAPCNYCSQASGAYQNFCSACGRLINVINVKLSHKDLIKILVVALSAIFIINLQVPVFALTDGPAGISLQTIGGGQAMTEILPEILGYQLQFEYRDTQFEKLLGQDASLAYAYEPADATRNGIWATLEIAPARTLLHRWEVCLETWPLALGRRPKVTSLSLRDVQLFQNPPIFGRYFAFQDVESNLVQVVLYWYETAYFNTGSNFVLEHVKISLIAFTSNPADIPNVEEQLFPLGEAVVNYWQPIKPWSSVALLLSEKASILLAIAIALLASILAYQIAKNRMEKESNLTIYNKLVLEEDKLVLQATHRLAKDTPTGFSIASCYRRLAGKPIEPDVLLQKLSEAERAGLVKRDMVSREDEPLLVWKSQLPI